MNGRNVGNSHPPTKGSAFQTKIPFKRPGGHNLPLQTSAVVLKSTASLQITQFCFFLWLSNIPLYICATSSLSIHLSMDT